MNRLFIISGPAGSGKDTVIEELGKNLAFERVITSTTRPMRTGESEGHPYHFLSRAAFEKKIANNEFVEYSLNENNEYYGVTRNELDRAMNTTGLVLWKIDWKGVISAKKIYPKIKALLITAPIDVLETRLRRRDGGTHTEAYFLERRKYTEEWLKHTDLYDFIIENEEGKIQETVQKVRHIIENTR